MIAYVCFALFMFPFVFAIYREISGRKIQEEELQEEELQTVIGVCWSADAIILLISLVWTVGVGK